MTPSKLYFKRFTTIFLTFGVSLLFGLLSFGGMYALWPLLSLSMASFFLSVFYEGEIYQKNIDSALDKLMAKDFVLQKLGENILNKIIKNNPKFQQNTFFADYQMLQKMKKTPENKERLQKMEIWFVKKLMILANYRKNGRAFVTQIKQDILDKKDVKLPHLLFNEDGTLKPQEKFSVGDVEAWLGNKREAQSDADIVNQLFQTEVAYLSYVQSIKDHKIKFSFATKISNTNPKAPTNFSSLDDSDYVNKLFKDLNQLDTLKVLPDDIEAELVALRNNHFNIQVFSIAASFFMSIGTIYLISETLGILSFMSISALAMPYVVLPLAFLSGIAYGFLTYNALTDFLMSDALSDLWTTLQEPFQQFSFQSLALGIGAFLIILLNLSLTICTAGTWWTVVNQTPAIWGFMKNKAFFILKNLIAPVVALSSLGFNLSNTLETIEGLKPKKQAEGPCCPPSPPERETLLQRLNPARLLLKMTYMPLKVLLFLGHLMSIGLTADRMPGVPAIVSALLGMISEGFEDAHYFFDLDALWTSDDECDHHGHEHSDLPNLCLQFLFSPLFLVSALWHWGFQESNRSKPFMDCFYVQIGWNAQKAQPTIHLHSWVQEEIKMDISEHIAYLQETRDPVACEKQEIIKTILKNIEQKVDMTQGIDEVKMDSHRGINFGGQTETRRFFDGLNKKYNALKEPLMLKTSH